MTAAQSCADTSPHAPHEWIGEALRSNCPGVTAVEHALVRDGAPDPLDTRPIRESGRAECSCRRWTSEPLLATEARRQAHAQHVTEEQS